MATIGVEDLKKMKVNDLKKELKDRGLPVSGTKDVLMERLNAAQSGAPIPAEESTAPVPAPADDPDSVEKSIDQLVGDTAPAKPVEEAPKAEAAVVPAKENIPKEDSEKIKKVLPPKDLSETDKLKARAEKFGAVSETAKKEKRAERFGIQASSAVTTGSIGTSDTDVADVGKLKKRAERFGEVVSNSLRKAYEDERKRKRLERFGTTAASSTEVKNVKLNSTDSDLEKLKARAEKFGAVSETAKKEKRAERFGIQASSAVTTGSIGTSDTDVADVGKLKKRAERFGEVVSNSLRKVDEDERKRKRLERFGTTAASSTEVKKVKLNSTDSDLEERKKKRAERFGLT
ncbi:hypothetical protein ACOMHN_034067 [Nucella lapillus]